MIFNIRLNLLCHFYCSNKILMIMNKIGDVAYQQTYDSDTIFHLIGSLIK